MDRATISSIAAASFFMSSSCKHVLNVLAGSTQPEDAAPAMGRKLILIHHEPADNDWRAAAPQRKRESPDLPGTPA